MVSNLEATRAAVSQFREKLDAAALKVLMGGKDWAEGPIEWDDDFFRDPAPPIIDRLSVRCGPVEPDWQPPHGWRVIRHSDWVAAGKPGLRRTA